MSFLLFSFHFLSSISRDEYSIYIQKTSNLCKTVNRKTKWVRKAFVYVWETNSEKTCVTSLKCWREWTVTFSVHLPPCQIMEYTLVKSCIFILLQKSIYLRELRCMKLKFFFISVDFRWSAQIWKLMIMRPMSFPCV